MATHRDGGKGTFTITLTTVLNNAARDRYLLVHVATAAAISVTLDKFDGVTAKFLANAVAIPANDTRDFGPFFIPNGSSLRGGASAASGDWSLDDVEP